MVSFLSSPLILEVSKRFVSFLSFGSEFTDRLASDEELNSVLENVHVHAVSVGHLRLDGQKPDDVAVFDDHSWKHAVEEGFDELVRVVS